MLQNDITNYLFTYFLFLVTEDRNLQRCNTLILTELLRNEQLKTHLRSEPLLTTLKQTTVKLTQQEPSNAWWTEFKYELSLLK